MRELFRLPDVGEGLTEAEIAEWKVAPGDTVTVNQIIVEIETAKAAVELPSPYAGTVGELLAEAGRMVQVGEPIIAIETVGDPAPSTAAAGSAAGAPASSASSASSSENGAKIGEAGRDGRIATLVGYGPRQGTVSRRPRRGTGPATGNPSPAQEPSPAGPAIGTPPAAPEPSPGPAGSSTTPTRRDESSSRPAGSYESSSHSGDAGGVGELERPALSGESSSRPAGSYESSSRSGGGGADRGVAGPTAGTVPLAPPPVRKLARDLGVDLYAVTGSGPHGRITRADVETAAAGPTSVAEAVTGADTVHGSGPAAGVPAAGPATEVAHPAVAAAGTAAAAGAAATGAAGAAVAGDPAVADTAVANGAGRPAARPSGLVDRREPIRGVRRATAEAMVSSAFTAPHVTEFLDVDVTETMQLRERLRASRAFAGVKLTPLAFVAKALCLAASRTPEVNARWDADAGEIVYFGRVQLGIAAATPRGLMVPKIRDADRLGLRDMAVALEALTTTAREGRTPPADLVGGTITITNVGVFGVDTGTPILNPGEAAILAVGSIKPAPWVVDGELAVRTVCRLALSFDHRLVDGEQGSRFLADVGTLLTDPGVAFTW